MFLLLLTTSALICLQHRVTVTALLQGRRVSLNAVWCIGIGAMPSSYAFLERAGKQPRGVGVHCGNERRRPPHFEAEPMEMTKGPYLNDVYTILGILSGGKRRPSGT